MKRTSWRERLLSSTRGRILNLLHARQHTVNELAAELNLTDNAVRAQLLALERDGLVNQAGTQRGFRKPHTTYALDPAAAQIFPDAYGRLITLLMSLFSRQLAPRKLRAGMRFAGRTVAEEHLREWKGKSRRQRIKAALAVLRELGAAAASFQEEDNIICGSRCPLAAVTADHPEACLIAESLLSHIIGRPVKEHCTRAPVPSCRFRVK